MDYMEAVLMFNIGKLSRLTYFGTELSCSETPALCLPDWLFHAEGMFVCIYAPCTLDLLQADTICILDQRSLGH